MKCSGFDVRPLFSFLFYTVLTPWRPCDTLIHQQVYESIMYSHQFSISPISVTPVHYIFKSIHKISFIFSHRSHIFSNQSTMEFNHSTACQNESSRYSYQSNMHLHQFTKFPNQSTVYIYIYSFQFIMYVHHINNHHSQRYIRVLCTPRVHI